MSKKHGHRKKRRKRSRPVTCPRCHSPADGSPEAFLNALASVMNSCAEAGLNLKLRHGIVMARGNDAEWFVLPLRGGRWTARSRTYDPLVSPAGDDDDED